jgi:hypothetical protein
VRFMLHENCIEPPTWDSWPAGQVSSGHQVLLQPT